MVYQKLILLLVVESDSYAFSLNKKTEGAKGLRRTVLPEYIMQLPSALQYNYCKAVVAILHVGMAQKQDDGNIQ